MSDVTVYIISSGEETYDECQRAVQRQTLNQKMDIPIEAIKDVYPMSEAFNEMHRRCQTPYFIQIDADMILNEDALEILYEGIKKSFFFHYVAYGQLYEEGFGPGGTVRCWKKGFFRFFQFRDCRTVDRDLFKRARRLGFQRKNLRKGLGVHRPRHSEFSEYLKAKSDVEKWRFLKRAPEKYALPLYDELRAEGDANRYKFFGLLLAALTSWDRVSRSKSIKMEKERLQNMLKLLGYPSLRELHLSPGILENNHARDLFASVYRKQDQQCRDQLIAVILKLFSRVENVPREHFEAETV